MWFRFRVSTKKSYYIVLAIVNFISIFYTTHQAEINDNTMQSIEAFMDELNEKDNDVQLMNRTLSVQSDDYKKLQAQSVPSSVVLMMKLISYYEDKFKVADHEPTEKGTTPSVRIEKEEKTSQTSHRIQRIGLKPGDRYNNKMMVPEVIIA